MKLSDHVADFIARQGVRHVFLISGGAAVHLVDSVAKHPLLKYVCTQHEQAAAMAADAYSRINGSLGVAMSTSGPGATNLVTGVCCAYFDSIPTLFITGQVARFRLKKNDRLRQKGFQETDVVSIFRPITKYAALVENPLRIRYELEKAVHLARSDRPGPVLLDIPDDVQRVDVGPEKLEKFNPEISTGRQSPPRWLEAFQGLIRESERPVLIYGAGIRLAKAEKQALEFAERSGIPVLLTWGGMDLMAYDHPSNVGGLGVCGPRGGNFAVQRADLVLAVGTRLSQMITGGKQELFAPGARKVVVDIDEEEFLKFPHSGIKLDLEIHEKIQEFFQTCLPPDLFRPKKDYATWYSFIQFAKKRFPICADENKKRKDSVDAYAFIEELSRQSAVGDIVITDAGGNLSWTMQAYRVKQGQRLFSAWNHSPMGYSLPASIGAALAGGRRVICIIGDGGIMMCLEELATIARHRLPVKIFIFNNHGHGIQKQTLDTWLDSRYEAVDEPTGLAFPDFLKVGEAFGLKTVTIRNHAGMERGIKEVLKSDGPVLCDVEIFDGQRIIPMLKFGGSLEDLEPTINAEESKEIEDAFLKITRNEKSERSRGYVRT